MIANEMKVVELNAAELQDVNGGELAAGTAAVLAFSGGVVVGVVAVGILALAAYGAYKLIAD
jgi:hypothetical protein